MWLGGCYHPELLLQSEPHSQWLQGKNQQIEGAQDDHDNVDILRCNWELRYIWEEIYQQIKM